MDRTVTGVAVFATFTMAILAACMFIRDLYTAVQIIWK